MSETSPDEVNSVLRAFQPFLRSIDMRTIAIRPEIGEDWENLTSSIIVSEKTVEEVTAEYEKLPKLKNKQIALFLFAAPFGYSIFEQLIETCNHIETLCDYGQIEFVPVLCSPKNFGETAKNNRIAIVDGDVIEAILKEIAKGDRESARSMVFYS